MARQRRLRPGHRGVVRRRARPRHRRAARGLSRARRLQHGGRDRQLRQGARARRDPAGRLLSRLVEIRAAAPVDVPALAELLLRASPGRTFEHEVENVRAYFERPAPVGGVAVGRGALAGVVSFEPSEQRSAYLRLLAVGPEHWGTGLATQLMQWA